MPVSIQFGELSTEHSYRRKEASLYIPRRGEPIRWGDRYDGWGLIVGVVVLLAVALPFTLAGDGGLRAWLAGFALACGVMNITSAALRRTIGRTKGPDHREGDQSHPTQDSSAPSSSE